MIANCIAILAVVAQISASDCGYDLPSAVFESSPQYNPVTPVVIVPSGNSGNSFGDSSSDAVTRNFVAKGKYPVALRNCGSSPNQQIPITTSRITAPVLEKPTVRLPVNIPAPRTISHSCTCYKTILRPRIQQHIITVPSVQRYVETSHKPVVENIQYEALPVNCGESGIQFVPVGAGSSSGAIRLVSVDSNCSCGSQVQAIEVPRVQVLEAQQVQAVQLPQIQAVQTVPFGSCTCQY